MADNATYALGYMLPAHFTWGGFAIIAGGTLLFVGLIAAVLILGWRPIR